MQPAKNVERTDKLRRILSTYSIFKELRRKDREIDLEQHKKLRRKFIAALKAAK